MGAIFLYRGNLHRVADIPRRWAMPQRAISLTQFRELIRKRNLAIAELSNSKQSNPIISMSNVKKYEGMEKTECPSEVQIKAVSCLELSGSAVNDCMDNTDDPLALKDGLHSIHDAEADANKELTCKVDTAADQKEEGKRDLEQKLHVLNEKKHYLVQMLKQILNAEEEIKRRSIQSALARSSVPLQAEASVEISYAARNPPKIGVEVNFGGDIGGELYAAGNYGIHSRQWPTMPAASLAATTIGRTSHGPFQHNTFYMPRGSAPLQATSSSLMASSMVSPSRFAPTSQQGHSMSLPSVSVAVTHFVASSPSPVASGGTSHPTGIPADNPFS